MTGITAIVDTQTGAFIESGHVPDARYVVTPLSRNPDAAREVWDPVTEFRDKTPAELAADVVARIAAVRGDAQRQVDAFPNALQAVVLALIDQLNVIRGDLRGLGVTGRPDITPAQALAAIRAKAGTL